MPRCGREPNPKRRAHCCKGWLTRSLLVPSPGKCWNGCLARTDGSVHSCPPPWTGRVLIPPPSPRWIPSPHDGEVGGQGEGKSFHQLKLQTPNTKLQRSSKSQAPKQRACDRFWNLKLEISLALGVWDLVFRSHLSPRAHP